MASRYWVGGTDTWNTTAGAKWATTSGGVGGASVPTAADDVFFDALSVLANATLSSNSVARSIDCTGFTGTITHPSSTTMNIGDGTAGAGNIALKLVAGMTYTLGNAATSALGFISTSTTQQTIDSGGKTLGNITVNGAASSYQLVAALTIGSTATLTLTNGTFDTNGQTCSWGLFALGAGTKALTCGASAITITGTGTCWSASTNGANFTVTPGTSTITLNGASITFAGNGKTYYNVSITGTGSASITGANVFNNFTRTLAAGNTGAIVMPSTTVNGIFTVTGANSGATAGRITVSPSLPTSYTASPAVLTVNGSYSFTNVDFNYVTAAGSATSPWTGTSMGDGTGNSNITFDASRTLYAISAGTSFGFATLNQWSLSSGGASASTAPLPQDDIVFDANSGVSASCSIASALRAMGRNLDFTNISNAATAFISFGGFSKYITGSLTLATGMTFKNSASSSLVFAFGASSTTLTTNGVSFIATDSPAFTIGLIFGGNGGSVTLASDVTTGGQVSMVGGTFSANGKNITCLNVTSTGGNTRTINLGTGSIWTVTGTGTVWTFGNNTGLTFNPQTSTIVISDTGASAKTFVSNGLTFNDISITGGGAGTVDFSNNSGAGFRNFTIGAPKTLRFGASAVAGYTLTLTGTFTAPGSAGNLISLTAVGAGVTWSISKASGIVSGNYLSLQDSNATGGAQWFAGALSTDVSGNSGWIFTDPAITVTDGATGGDTATKAVTAAKADSAIPTDADAKTVVTAAADSVALSETFLKSVGKPVSDAIAASSPDYLAVALDGTDDYINIPHNGSIEVGDNDSYSMVVRVKISPGTLKAIVSKGNLTGVCSFAVQLNSDGNLEVIYKDASNTASAVISGTWADNLEHRLVLIRRRPNNDMRVYIDGTLRETIPDGSVGGQLNNSVAVQIGRWGTRFGNPTVREFGLFTYAITAGDVTNLESGTWPADPRVRLAFSEGTGTTIADISGFNNHGTINGGGTWVPLAVTKAVSPVKSDSVTASDTSTKAVAAIKTDSTTPAEAASNYDQIVKSDSVTASDTATRQITGHKNLSDSVTATDTTAQTIITQRLATDLVTVSDRTRMRVNGKPWWYVPAPDEWYDDDSSNWYA